MSDAQKLKQCYRVVTLPGFDDSLRLLVEGERYAPDRFVAPAITYLTPPV